MLSVRTVSSGLPILAIPLLPGSLEALQKRPDADGPPVDSVAFLDERARSLVEAARARWLRVDRSIRSYEAIVQSRARVWLRTPLKDRTLYRAEAASRVRWAADGSRVIQVLGSRITTPEGSTPGGYAFTDPVFDPQGAFSFGFMSPGTEADSVGSEEPATTDERPQPIVARVVSSLSVVHPIAPGSETHYRYAVSDSVRVNLPDGRSVAAVQVKLIPRSETREVAAGAIWIQPESGALVRAVYRIPNPSNLRTEFEAAGFNTTFLPGAFRPLEFEVSLVAVEYSLWNSEYWLPHSVRLEGTVRAGVLRVPGIVEQAFRILDVVGAGAPRGIEDAASVATRWSADGEWISGDQRGEFQAFDIDDFPPRALDANTDEDGESPSRIILVPRHNGDLHASGLLPPPVGDDAPAFASEGEVVDILQAVASRAGSEGVGSAFGLFFSASPLGFARYNRAQGYAPGARMVWSPAVGAGFGGLEAEGWLRISTWVPDVRVTLSWDFPLHRLSLQGYHRIDDVDPRARNLSTGNSVTALAWGRDDGDYFRASGVSMRWEPTGVRRGWYHAALSIAEHSALPNVADFTIAEWFGAEDNSFRAALAAEPAIEYAATVGLSPWWGTEAGAWQGGVEILLQGAVGDFRWVRTRMLGRAAVPLARWVRMGVEIGGGLTWGDPPLQRHWFLGGAHTLRGYGGAAAVGPGFFRGRVDLAAEVVPPVRLSCSRMSAGRARRLPSSGTRPSSPLEQECRSSMAFSEWMSLIAFDRRLVGGQSSTWTRSCDAQGR